MSSSPSCTPPARPVVLDTNWALDLLVFHDPSALPLLHTLQSGTWQWLACAPMREEFHRVLGYPAIVRRLAVLERSAEQALAAFDALAVLAPVPAPVAWRCRDPDDQVFIDLACAHRALLLSKDREVLKLRRALVLQGVDVRSTYP